MPKIKLFDENEVLEKAMNLFWTKGYHATSIQDLVNYLGISRSSLYDTFGGKKSLFDKTLKHYCNDNIQATNEFLKSQTNVKDAFRKLFTMLISESLDDGDRKGCFVVNSTTELAQKDKDVLEILMKNKTTFEDIFYKFLLLGQQRGDITGGKDLKAIASLMYTLFSGLKVVTKVETEKLKLTASIDMVLSLLD